MAKLQQEENTVFHAGFFQPEAFKQKAVQIKVLETALAGMGFHVEDEQEEENIQELIPGTELKLYREPDNEYDEWAIAVYYGEDDQLGYITRYKNETIARLMDAGKRFIAIVDEPREAKKEKQEFKQAMRFGKAPTERGIPISVYLVED